MKKRICLILVLVMIAAIITSCGLSGAATPAMPATDATAPDTAEESIEDGTTGNSIDENHDVSTEISDTSSDADDTIIDSDISVGNQHKRIDPDIMKSEQTKILQSDEDRFVYNDEGYLVQWVDTDWNDNAYAELEFEYDENGRVSIKKENDTNGTTWCTTTYERDSLGRTTKIITDTIYAELLPYTEYIYDDSGKLVYEYSYQGNGERDDTYTAYLYDEEGNRVKREARNTDSDEIITYDVYEYDSDGLLIKATLYYIDNSWLERNYYYENGKFDHLVQKTEIYGEEIAYDFFIPANLGSSSACVK